jgi:photosystem II stability/assembly factor-like uncharacterized protein
MQRWLDRSGFLLSFALACFAIFPGHLNAAPPQNPSQFDQRLFQELHWRSIGPFRAGRVLAVTGVRGEPDVYYSGAVGGGVWKTNDAGRTWIPIFDSQPVASIGAIAVAPSDPNVIYVGSGEADMRSSISTGNGMYKSVDAGKTWTRIGLQDSRHIGRILVDPRDANRVFVAALGHAYGPNPERGVFRSMDGGKSWLRVLFKDENTGAIDLAFEPGNTHSIYAALWQTRRPPWSIYASSNGPGSGVYRSTDGGDHWQPVTGHGLPSEGLGRIGIAFAPSNPQRIFLLMEAKEAGLYRSDDHGENWKRVSTDRRISQRSWYFGEISVDPKDPNTVYVPNVATYKSQDGGVTFDAWKGAPGGDDYHELWIDPENPQRMILSCDQGAIVTRNSGQTWSSWLNQPNGQFYHVATDNQFPYWVYGAQQDSGSAATASRSKYSSLNLHDWRPVEAGDENGYIAPDPLNPSVIYGGFVTRQDMRNEEIQQMPPTLAHSGSFRRTWTLPLVFSPTDPHVLYFGSQVLFRTADGGNSWEIISPDLTREDPGVPANLDPATAADAPPSKRRGVIYTIAPSYTQAGEIWAGTDDGRIHLTRDEGRTWTEVTPPEITSWSKVTHIEASHFDAGTAYAAVDRHRLEDLNPYLYRTRDFGKSWKRVSLGIPEGSWLNCIREDPLHKNLLYACTETGVYVSFNEGENWQPLQLNLPTTSVRDLVIHGDDLVIATFGRAFWILDDITPLRLLDSQIAASDAWLFAPATTFRLRPGYDQSTPVPIDEPMADNPPDGAVLDYYLKDKSAAPVTLEIIDDQGKLVRRFASDDVLYKTKPESLAFTMNWVHDQQPLINEAGMHRFLWDLHAALPSGVERSEFLSTGPWVLPGNYSVKLTAKGKILTQPLVVKPDPRSNATPEALRLQFVLGSQLMQQLSEISTAQQQSTELQKQIEARRKNAVGKPEILTTLDQLEQKAKGPSSSSYYGYFMLFGLSLPEAGHESFTHIEEALTGLYVVVQNADVAPSSDVTLAAQKWHAAAQEVLSAWKMILEKDLPNMNAELRNANLQPITIK